MKLSDTIARLAANRARSAPHSGAARDRLTDLADFGSNPGNLRARCYVPPAATARPALVVVLHGCTQTAAGYDHGAGWSTLADEHGFVLLFPEQQRVNNPNLCFNWFAPADNRRGAGEALSIRQMIAAMIAQHDVDPARLFITGLSAGGAMTAAMLATYPELFAGGAIIGGLPYGSASGVPQAMERMRGQGGSSEAALETLVRGASDHGGAWPIVSIWHGGSDEVVDPVNADGLVTQWRALHGVASAPAVQDVVDGYPRRRWQDAGGRAVIEDYRITGLGHGTPLATRGGDRRAGTAGPFMLEAGISSSHHILDFWGLTTAPAASARADDDRPALQPAKEAAFLPALRSIRPTRIEPPASAPAQAAGGVQQVIEDALRAAGLMR